MISKVIISLNAVIQCQVDHRNRFSLQRPAHVVGQLYKFDNLIDVYTKFKVLINSRFKIRPWHMQK